MGKGWVAEPDGREGISAGSLSCWHISSRVVRGCQGREGLLAAPCYSACHSPLLSAMPDGLHYSPSSLFLSFFSSFSSPVSMPPRCFSPSLPLWPYLFFFPSICMATCLSPSFLPSICLSVSVCRSAFCDQKE